MRARDQLDPGLLLAVFAGAVIIFALRAYANAGQGPLLSDTDDAMRMVVVRDFLAGQGWYDHVQHRLNTPYGAEIHWSRLIDLPLAALIAMLRPIAGPMAETIAAWAWPLLLFGALLWLSGHMALRLVGPEGVLPALVLPILSPAVTAEFSPGRIDHHNVQIVLTLAIAWAVIESLKRPRFAVLAGVLCATAIAIGIEALPAVATAILAFGLVWVFDPARGDRLRDFGLAFAGGTAVHLAIALPPQRWFEPACDMLSLTYLVGAVVVGIAFAGLSLLRGPRGIGPRLAIGIAVGLAALGLLALLFPACLGGPYAALDPWLRENWIDAIAEAKPWWESLDDLPAYTLAVGIPPVLALVVIAVRLRRDAEDRGEWLLLGLFLFTASLVMLAQVRGARVAAMPAIPAATWLITVLRARFLARRDVAAAAALLMSWLAFAGVIVVLVVNAVVGLVPGRAQTVAEARADRRDCLMPQAFADLAALPPERILTPIDLGAHMLLETPHEVVAAPYHRNEAGVRDTFAAFNAPIAEARQILAARGIGLVVTCPAMAEMQGLPSAASDSFVKLAPENALPAWLEKVDTAGPLEIYAVLPSAAAR